MDVYYYLRGGLGKLRDAEGFTVTIKESSHETYAVLKLLRCEPCDHYKTKEDRFIQFLKAFLSEEDVEKMLVAYGLLEGYTQGTADKRRVEFYKNQGATIRDEKHAGQVAGRYRKQEEKLLEYLSEKVKEIEIASVEIDAIFEDAPVSADVTDINVEYDSDECYVDRNNLHETIHAHFTDKESVVLMQTIIGLGGIGKTTTAKRYARANRENYDLIRLINAETEVSLRDSAVDFLDEKMVDYNKNNTRVVQNKFRNWFETQPEWKRGFLLVFDNVEDFNLVRSYIPSSKQGRCLFTTRRTDLPNWLDSRNIPLGCFEEEEAVEFLLKRTGLTDVSGAEMLAERLGCLPLALEQAGAYMRTMSHPSFREYLSLLEANGLSMFDPLDTDMYKKTVRTTWDISMEKITIESAKRLLMLFSYFAADDIPFSYVVETVKHLPYWKIPHETDAQLEAERHRILYELTKYSLVKRNEITGWISMHRLLQEVIREKSECDEYVFVTLWNHFFEHMEAILMSRSRGDHDWSYTNSREHIRAFGAYLVNMIGDNREDSEAYFSSLGFYYRNLAWLYIWRFDLTVKELEFAIEALRISLEMYKCGGAHGRRVPIFLCIDEVAEEPNGADKSSKHVATIIPPPYENVLHGRTLDQEILEKEIDYILMDIKEVEEKIECLQAGSEEQELEDKL